MVNRYPGFIHNRKPRRVDSSELLISHGKFDLDLKLL
jgi:hypothetical protein